MTWSRRGMTLTELMITVVIIGILAGVAAPQYNAARQRSYWRAARDILLAIHAGEQIYFARNAVYQALGTAPGEPWLLIFMDNPNVNSPIPVTFDVTGVSLLPTPTFTARATLAGNPRLLTVNEDRTVVSACWNNFRCWE